MTGSDPTAQRRESRERAVELSYEAFVRQISPEALVETLPTPPEGFTRQLLGWLVQYQTEADELIAATAKGWTLERMPTIDLLIMRMAVAELLADETPSGVVLAESTDLAVRYSTERSGSFVNGVLAAISDRENR